MNRHENHGDEKEIYTITCEGRGRFVIYNASAIGNPNDHEPNKWYFRPYPVPVGVEAGHPFETAEDAERAARASGDVDSAAQA